ncbi:uncharacterized protein K489DRAFT_383838 [Dissoconium aciculare CBS 342.82]|uniref:Uncharacterized protein n=1 Tax=Dissoconium aciculare CBS 342.82 TaxID=1314786 RepID=A0A6J3LVA1_9PEZI|nr:uncharacterized protein K489DRAFT_383838 [Dissoconium aciculare CBS 342.82]KAF1819593.1 hypothetical protein K489DRAFT_383838 [Dissoconium aciculare CBS 342.82]
MTRTLKSHTRLFSTVAAYRLDLANATAGSEMRSLTGKSRYGSLPLPCLAYDYPSHSLSRARAAARDRMAVRNGHDGSDDDDHRREGDAIGRCKETPGHGTRRQRAHPHRPIFCPPNLFVSLSHFALYLYLALWQDLVIFARMS